MLQAGTGQNIGQYRRLISAGCGGQIAVHEVDNVMTQLLEVSTGYDVVVVEL
jgi:hypothetical protein